MDEVWTRSQFPHFSVEDKAVLNREGIDRLHINTPINIIVVRLFNLSLEKFPLDFIARGLS